MARELRLSPDLSLPADAVTQKVALLARSGAGKTYAAGKLVEELVAADAQVVIVDPVGVHWGLRLAADGKSPGISIYVFGGQHADVPLESTGGELVADLITQHGVSAILDVSDMTGGEQRRFVADFATHLLQKKKSNRSPLMIVWEECQDFVPQRVMRDAARMVGAMERLIKQGRNFGVGTTLISQRPQAVNKDVLNQTECLIVLQTTGPQERKTIQGWIVENGAEVAAAVDELPSLKRGEAFVWSPQWLRTFKKIHIGRKWTFDASSTPAAGDKAKVARKLAPVDLKAVEAAMKDTIERAKQDDPAELRKQIAALQRQLKSAAIDPKAIEQAEQRGETRGRQAAAAELRQLQKHLTDREGRLRKIESLAHLNGEAATAAATPSRPHAPPKITIDPTSTIKKAHAESPPRPARPAADTDVTLGKCERSILAVLSQYPEGCERGKLALLSGYKWSGGFRNSLSTLRRQGLIVGGNEEVMRITDAGEDCGPFELLPTGRALVEYWLNHRQFGRCEREILGSLVAHPAGMTAEELCRATGYEWSGGFRNSLSTLRTAGVIVGRNTERMQASPELLEGTAHASHPHD